VKHFILGNGPSIKQTPLDLLKNRITWGMNRPPIKPTFYYCMDVHERDRGWRDAIRANLDCARVFLWEGWKEEFEGRNIVWLPRCERHHWYAADNFRRRAESWHLPDVCTAFGSMYVVMQLAVLYGATEIHLLGCDQFTGTGDHYREDYPEFVDQNVRNQIEQHIHTVSRRSSPVPIYNATIGGSLEVHPRVNLFEVLNAPQEEVYRPGT
jgi:hypothetical protein